MTNKEFNELFADLERASVELKNLYLENGGEFTPEAEQMESYISAVADILANDGIDYLGRRLKAKEDEKKALVNEKAFVDRHIKATEQDLVFIKGIITKAMEREEIQKAKGKLGYSFTAYDSVETSANKDVIKELFQAKIEQAAKELNFPCDITITLGASVKQVPEGAELPIWYTRTITPAVKFLKPKEVKEKKADEEPIQ